jgi:hypothetical protein
MNSFSVRLVLGTWLIGMCACASLALGQIASSNAASSTTEPPASSSSLPSAAIKANAAKPEDQNAIDPASLIPDLPPLPSAKATLVGGTIQKLDRVQDRVTLELFGGGKTTVFFDGRTNVYRDGQPSSLAALKPGERIYLDTILLNDMVFARNIRLRTGQAEGDSQGVVMSYRPDRNELVVRDMTAPKPLKLSVTPKTLITKNGQPSSTANLKEGMLVTLKFGSGDKGSDFAQQISIVAEPGQSFTFSGKVKFLDLHDGLIVLVSSTNGKTYEVYLEPSAPVDEKLHEGADVTALARFEQNRYVAHTVTVNSNPQ